jgi:hypothetical protein
MSIGDHKEPLPQLKIKDNVDHAGHSPPPDLWKDYPKLEMEPYKAFLNHNWSTAQDHMETKDATED